MLINNGEYFNNLMEVLSENNNFSVRTFPFLYESFIDNSETA